MWIDVTGHYAAKEKGPKRKTKEWATPMNQFDRVFSGICIKAIHLVVPLKLITFILYPIICSLSSSPGASQIAEMVHSNLPKTGALQIADYRRLLE